MIRVGIAGLGFMGMVHYLTYQKLPGVKVVAIADNHPERLAGDWTAIKGNFGPPGEQMDLADVTGYSAAEELIADPAVDLVDICLPPAAHADIAIEALAAGKHVFCEKPMALKPADCDRMLNAADSADRRLFVGQVLPFFPEYAWALAEIRSGKHGRLVGGSFKRVISDPAWLANYWEADQVGGPMLDLHVHDAHFIRLVFGMPTEVTTRGSLRNSLPEHWHSLMRFGADGPDGGAVVHATSGVLDQQGRPFLHGFEIRLEQATLAFEFAVSGEVGAYTCPPTLYDSNGGAQQVELGDGDPMQAFHSELRHAVSVLEKGHDADALDGLLARDALAICQMQIDSLANSQ